jgi:formylglycine-generating enzyme required for sulfatase activity
MVMVYVPAGEFQMGSTDEQVDYVGELCNEPYADCQREWFEREQPAHVVALDGFWLDRTEVTNAHFAAFLNEEGNQEEGGVTWLRLESDYCLIERVGDEYRPKSGYADHPVIGGVGVRGAGAGGPGVPLGGRVRRDTAELLRRCL